MELIILLLCGFAGSWLFTKNMHRMVSHRQELRERELLEDHAIRQAEEAIRDRRLQQAEEALDAEIDLAQTELDIINQSLTRKRANFRRCVDLD